jgi:hypothetical protein
VEDAAGVHHSLAEDAGEHIVTLKTG